MLLVNVLMILSVWLAEGALWLAGDRTV